MYRTLQILVHGMHLSYPNLYLLIFVPSSRTLSMFVGILFIGIGLGPSIGGVLIRLSENVLSVFIAATFVHLVYAFMIWFVIPESVPPPRMIASRLRYKEELRSLKEAREGVAAGVAVRIRRLFGFLTPLTIFMPATMEGQQQNPLKKEKKDWNLTLVAVSYGLVILIMVGFYLFVSYIKMTDNTLSQHRDPFRLSFSSLQPNIIGRPRRFVILLL